MPRGLAQKTTELIDAAYSIAAARNPITVRGIAYQLFNMRLIPNMGKSSTNRVSRAVTTARENHWIPWEWIVDEHRSIDRPNTWDDPARYFYAVQNSYRKDRWADQPQRILMMSEKGTVGGILQPILHQYGVPFLVAHGFSSATVVNNLAQESLTDDRPLTILYVGDYDPSGLYMSDVDLPRRLFRYAGEADVVRIALLRSHCQGLPSFPVASKSKDARYQWYASRFGSDCWELDAMDPNRLRDTVEQAIEGYIDFEMWDRAEAVEAAEMKSLSDFFSTNPLFSGKPQNGHQDGGAR